jgi:hypothetical protein
VAAFAHREVKAEHAVGGKREAFAIFQPLPNAQRGFVDLQVCEDGVELRDRLFARSAAGISGNAFGPTERLDLVGLPRRGFALLSALF